MTQVTSTDKTYGAILTTSVVFPDQVGYETGLGENE